MSDDKDWVGFIDGPGPFASLTTLIEWKKECEIMIKTYPVSEAWRYEYEEVLKNIVLRMQF